ncbi:MAG TPA: hypothetical protein VJQ43_05440 [Thermoplasmata archaeon]|nr:hypothetical protein [Thermoplasmata archaeon]
MAALIPPALEHLTPHDLVTYSRCPHEMELHRAVQASLRAGAEVVPRTPPGVHPDRHSPLFSPPVRSVTVFEGRLDFGPLDRLVYRDEGETGLPVLFSPEQTELDGRIGGPHGTLVDHELGFAGRPDLVVRRAGGDLVPVEYKATHLFHDVHGPHGRTFDTIQAIAECRLVHAVTGHRPTHGIVLYGDTAGDGAREGWVEVVYGEAEEHWLRAALVQVRADTVRAPVPTPWNCAGCEPNREGRCRFAASHYDPTLRNPGAR